jgi:carboxymethylenebutenolidase
MTRTILAVLSAWAIALLAQTVHAQSIPPGEEGAKAALKSSPRHGEWVDINADGYEKPIRTYVVYPERADNAPVVIVIHEIYGMTDWIRSVADQLAAEGFIAIVPDLLSGMGPDGGGTEAFDSRDDVVAAVRKLSDEQVIAGLNAVRVYGAGLPSARNKIATVGFCWGGTQSFAYAAAQPELDAAIVYYGTSPDDEALAGVEAPVLGLYGGDDARVVSTVAPAKARMEELNKTYETHVYDGAGHGFLRQQDGRDGSNLEASRKAWSETIAFLRKHLDDERKSDTP